MSRRYMNFRIDLLEEKFDAAHAASDIDTLNRILNELNFRETKRAKALRERVVRAIGTVKKPNQPSVEHIEQSEREIQFDLGVTELIGPKNLSQHPVQSEILTVPTPRKMPRRTVSLPSRMNANQANAVLSSWIALEVLSPFLTFRRPQDLIEGNIHRVIDLDASTALPWMGASQAQGKGRRYYHIVLGTIRMDVASEALLAVYSDANIENVPPSGHAPMAILTIDRDGQPVAPDALAISSFAWGLPIALRRELSALEGWISAERRLVDAADRVIRRCDEHGQALPVDRTLIDDLFRHLSHELGVDDQYVSPPSFALQVDQHPLATDPPEPPPMGSFFLGDLARAKAHLALGTLPALLVSYLGLKSPDRRVDLRDDSAALAEALAPARIPLGQWPAPNAYPLVTLQQCAVNFAMTHTEETSLLPVNGPPGTGKTTLLRDLIASVVVERARVMCGFADPSHAFSSTGLKTKSGRAFIHQYAVDQRLKGFELIVASTNNKAVENVSAEVPAVASIDEKRETLRYFQYVADNVARSSRGASVGSQWGLIAAVLGNAKNRYVFRQAAWSDEDHGLRAYLLEASGHPQTIEVKDPNTGRIVETRPPAVIAAEKPPKGTDAALRRWKAARRRFLAAVKLVEERLTVLQRGHEALHLADLGAELQATAAQLQQAETKLARLDTDRDIQLKRGAQLVAERQKLESALAEHGRERPSILSRLLSSRQLAEWEQRQTELLREKTSNSTAVRNVEATLASIIATQDTARRDAAAIRHSATTITARIEARRIDIQNASEISGPRIVDATFLGRSQQELQIDTPWLDAETLRLRTDLFEAAIAVHRAFIDAAAKEIRNNLDLLFKTFFGRSAWSQKMQPAMPDLWATFFCVVPVVSTAFASVDRMFGYLGPAALGLLLVDEAGQATPQAAVGALLRAKRAVVVGDPKQLPPVTTLPTDLAESIAAEFGVDQSRFVAPEATVQSLADASSAFGTAIDQEWVGLPLVVHRRCAEPMFSLANRLAYDGSMVLGRSSRPSAIRDILGPSAWIDIKPGRCDDKWSEAEGQAAIRLLHKLKQAGIADPDIFLITPFRIVAQRLRQTLLQSGILAGWTTTPSSWVRDRVGTVYTVQGREADTVIMLLGAAEPQRRGARSWAGETVNQLNVAVTRAKENLYVIGNRFEWASAGHFASLERALP